MTKKSIRSYYLLDANLIDQARSANIRQVRSLLIIG
jgi:hypothetical protein